MDGCIAIVQTDPILCADSFCRARLPRPLTDIHTCPRCGQECCVPA